ncbi:MAG: hypothetical protein NXH89_08295 [Cyclobacteriaceae bacterium]|uniref:Uncharacterized protein n=1 Tax=Algoriphagus marincola TaxID=264027 RepID=A0ABS7N7U4_9BACT|nr:hypothetical protein [Algoriphagus marincola]MBY5952060.1 hypothetical protein [Algoriphagus marincola]MCR9082403.1 hypothetical protein [Cyclobacteriaceae bacterium]
MGKYIKTNTGIFVLFLFMSIQGFGQAINISSDSTVNSKPRTDDRVSFRPSSGLFDEETNSLNRANDTLNIYIESQKKVSIVSFNIKEFENFGGYEEDIPDFLALIDQLNLDFSEKAFKIRYNPVIKELSIEENNQIRLKAFENNVYPVFKHEVIFVYRKQLMEISMFLGEWDEILVLGQADLTAMIKREAKENDWFERYSKTIFNKDIRIDEKGLLKVITYTEVEKSHTVSFGFDVGVNFFAGQLPFHQEISLVYRPRQIIKSVPLDFGLLISWDMNQFISRTAENKYQVNEGSFLNVGAVFGEKERSLRVYYGRLITHSDQNFFEFNRNKVGIDVLATLNLRVSYEFFFGSRDSETVNSIGISFPLVKY